MKGNKGNSAILTDRCNPTYFVVVCTELEKFVQTSLLIFKTTFFKLLFICPFPLLECMTTYTAQSFMSVHSPNMRFASKFKNWISLFT